MPDLISNASIAPSYEDIRAFIHSPVQELWMELNEYIQEQFKSKPKIHYSTCAGKPGWNVKYQKSGKSICTLYPEQNCFTALVVIKQDLAPLIATTSPEFHPLIQDLVKNSKPFNHTLWLMIPITARPVLESVLDLLQFKMSIQK